ncbi:MAG: hypothetical protein ACE5JG_07365 [Planctomycetota bacterium]
MRRLGLLLVPAAALLVFLLGRPPSQGLLGEHLDAYHRERVQRHTELSARLGALQRELERGASLRNPSARRELEATVARLKKRIEAHLRAHHRATLGGWEVVFLPGGADPPDRTGFFAARPVDPSRATDPSPLRGPVEILMRPRSAPARWLAALGLGP